MEFTHTRSKSTENIVVKDACFSVEILRAILEAASLATFQVSVRVRVCVILLTMFS